MSETTHSHTPRPRNSWIIYRSEKLKEMKEEQLGINGPTRQTELSRSISVMWRHETPEVRHRYAQKASAEAKAHRAMYPEYRYQPKRRRGKDSLTPKTVLKKSASTSSSTSSLNSSEVFGSHGPSNLSTNLSSDVNLGMGQQIPVYGMPLSPFVDISQQETSSNMLGLWLFRPDAGVSFEDIYPSGNTLPSLFPHWDPQETIHTFSQGNFAPLLEADAQEEFRRTQQFAAHGIFYYGNDDAYLFPTSNTPC